MGGKPAL